MPPPRGFAVGSGGYKVVASTRGGIVSRILALSSWTSVGHVGLSAIVPALQMLGHDVTQLPTIFLSNHTGWPRCAGHQVDVAHLEKMIDAIEANGWLEDHAAILTGYLPGTAHVALACNLVDRLRRLRSTVRVVVDPILGDDPKGLYLAEDAASAIRERLVPRADILTPNRFELGWLTGRPVGSLTEVRAAAGALSREGACDVIVTSPPCPDGGTGALEVTGKAATLFPVARVPDVPNGAGDVFSALIAAGLTAGEALGHLRVLVEASSGADHLRIVAMAAPWMRAGSIAGQTLPVTRN